MFASAVLFYNAEFEPHYGEPISQCSLLLRRARERGGGTAVNLVLTHYRRPPPDAPGTPSKCNPDNWRLPSSVFEYCVKWEWDAPCRPPDAGAARKFEEGAARCVREAFDLGFRDVLISPHLDDASGKGYWCVVVVALCVLAAVWVCFLAQAPLASSLAHVHQHHNKPPTHTPATSPTRRPTAPT
jgi:hypothetical protein